MRAIGSTTLSTHDLRDSLFRYFLEGSNVKAFLPNPYACTLSGNWSQLSIIAFTQKQKLDLKPLHVHPVYVVRGLCGLVFMQNRYQFRHRPLWKSIFDWSAYDTNLFFFFAIFWFIAVFKIRNNRANRLASSPWPFFSALRVRLGGPLSKGPKRPCYIDMTLKTSTCEDTSVTMVEKGESRR